jgi:hypothetical protein
VFDATDFGSAIYALPEAAMTIVVAAHAIDGVVIASDSRETTPAAFAHVDNQVKVLRFGNALVGIGGAGQWLTGANASAWDAADSAFALASALHRHIDSDAGFPNVTCLCASPVDGLAIVQRASPEESPLRWRSPALLPAPRWRAIGLPMTANAVFDLLWQDQMDTETAAALCCVCIAMTAMGCPYAGGPIQVRAIFADSSRVWDEELERRTLLRARGWLAKIREISW